MLMLKIKLNYRWKHARQHLYTPIIKHNIPSNSFLLIPFKVLFCKINNMVMIHIFFNLIAIERNSKWCLITPNPSDISFIYIT